VELRPLLITRIAILLTGGGVRCDSKTLTVRGLFWSRTISKSSICAITVFPAVRWCGRSGRMMWTPINAFAESNSVIPAVARRNEDAIAALQRWHASR
jgi:hypothetical protein